MSLILPYIGWILRSDLVILGLRPGNLAILARFGRFWSKIADFCWFCAKMAILADFGPDLAIVTQNCHSEICYCFNSQCFDIFEILIALDWIWGRFGQFCVLRVRQVPPLAFKNGRFWLFSTKLTLLYDLNGFLLKFWPQNVNSQFHEWSKTLILTFWADFAQNWSWSNSGHIWVNNL